MPAHDTPYFEPAGGQNSEASSVAKAFSLGPIAGDSLAGGMPPWAGHHRQVITRHPGAPARCLTSGSGAARVRCWCAHRVPAGARDRGPGGMRDRTGTWRPPGAGRGGARPLAGRGTRSPGRPAPRARAAGRGHGTGGRHLRLDRYGRGRAVAPGTGGPLCGTGRGPVAIWREGSPSGLGPVRLRLCPTVPLPVLALLALGSLGYQGARI